MPKPDELPAVPDGDVTAAVDVSAQRAARLTALRAHATQVALWEEAEVAFAMSNGVAQPLLDVEEFALLAGEPDGPDAVDLFAGVA
jgi:N-acetyl-1-D-myo-inositol-2-amino-2-deoxy-alpha-D-glucopyranoside deacetylase